MSFRQTDQQKESLLQTAVGERGHVCKYRGGTDYCLCIYLMAPLQLFGFCDSSLLCSLHQSMSLTLTLLLIPERKVSDTKLYFCHISCHFSGFGGGPQVRDKQVIQAHNLQTQMQSASGRE